MTCAACTLQQTTANGLDLTYGLRGSLHFLSESAFVMLCTPAVADSNTEQRPVLAALGLAPAPAARTVRPSVFRRKLLVGLSCAILYLDSMYMKKTRAGTTRHLSLRASERKA